MSHSPFLNKPLEFGLDAAWTDFLDHQGVSLGVSADYHLAKESVFHPSVGVGIKVSPHHFGAIENSNFVNGQLALRTRSRLDVANNWRVSLGVDLFAGVIHSGGRERTKEEIEAIENASGGLIKPNPSDKIGGLSVEGIAVPRSGYHYGAGLVVGAEYITSWNLRPVSLGLDLNLGLNHVCVSGNLPEIDPDICLTSPAYGAQVSLKTFMDWDGFGSHDTVLRSGTASDTLTPAYSQKLLKGIDQVQRINSFDTLVVKKAFSDDEKFPTGPLALVHLKRAKNSEENQKVELTFYYWLDDAEMSAKTDSVSTEGGSYFQPTLADIESAFGKLKPGNHRLSIKVMNPPATYIIPFSVDSEKGRMAEQTLYQKKIASAANPVYFLVRDEARKPYFNPKVAAINLHKPIKAIFEKNNITPMEQLVVIETVFHFFESQASAEIKDENMRALYLNATGNFLKELKDEMLNLHERDEGSIYRVAEQVPAETGSYVNQFGIDYWTRFRSFEWGGGLALTGQDNSSSLVHTRVTKKFLDDNQGVFQSAILGSFGAFTAIPVTSEHFFDDVIVGVMPSATLFAGLDLGYEDIFGLKLGFQNQMGVSMGINHGGYYLFNNNAGASLYLNTDPLKIRLGAVAKTDVGILNVQGNEGFGPRYNSINPFVSLQSSLANLDVQFKKTPTGLSGDVRVSREWVTSVGHFGFGIEGYASLEETPITRPYALLLNLEYRVGDEDQQWKISSRLSALAGNMSEGKGIIPLPGLEGIDDEIKQFRDATNGDLSKPYEFSNPVLKALYKYKTADAFMASEEMMSLSEPVRQAALGFLLRQGYLIYDSAGQSSWTGSDGNLNLKDDDAILAPIAESILTGRRADGVVCRGLARWISSMAFRAGYAEAYSAKIQAHGQFHAIAILRKEGGNFTVLDFGDSTFESPERDLATLLDQYVKAKGYPPQIFPYEIYDHNGHKQEIITTNTAEVFASKVQSPEVLRGFLLK